MAAMEERMIVSGGDEVRCLRRLNASRRSKSGWKARERSACRMELCSAQAIGAIRFGGWMPSALCRPGFLRAGRG